MTRSQVVLRGSGRKSFAMCDLWIKHESFFNKNLSTISTLIHNHLPNLFFYSVIIWIRFMVNWASCPWGTVTWFNHSVCVCQLWHYCSLVQIWVCKNTLLWTHISEAVSENSRVLLTHKGQIVSSAVCAAADVCKIVMGVFTLLENCQCSCFTINSTCDHIRRLYLVTNELCTSTLVGKTIRLKFTLWSEDITWSAERTGWWRVEVKPS